MKLKITLWTVFCGLLLAVSCKQTDNSIKNFYCTEDTCFFFYQPYSIAAGYKGIVEIPVPQAKLHETGIR